MKITHKTYSQKPDSIKRNWFVVDASELPLGRLATQVAALLNGKQKTTFTRHMDNGDYVVVINSDKLVVTGNKDDQKMYYRHSGYPGNLHEATLAEVKVKDSRKAITEAVRGMLPKNKLSVDKLERLKVFKGAEHNHTAQMPKAISLKGVKSISTKETE